MSREIHYDGVDGGDAPGPPGLRVQNGAGEDAFLEAALAVYVWAADDATNDGAKPGKLLAALADGRDELLRIKPDAVVLHASPSTLMSRPHKGDNRTQLELAVIAVRELLPGVRVWLGVGCDGWVDEWRAGKATSAQVQGPLMACGALAHQLGVEVCIWNIEGQWKHAPTKDVRTRAELEDLARDTMRACAAAAPQAIHGVSSFDHVGMHMAMPWRGLLGLLGDTNIAFFTAQNYVAMAGEPAKGALPGREKSAGKSQDAAERQGAFPDDVAASDPQEDTHDDVDRTEIPTVQLHKTDPTDLCSIACRRTVVIGWSVPRVGEGGRADDEGVEAYTAARVIRSVAGCGADAVRRYQRDFDLAQDNRPGTITRAHALSRAG